MRLGIIKISNLLFFISAVLLLTTSHASAVPLQKMDSHQLLLLEEAGPLFRKMLYDGLNKSGFDYKVINRPTTSKLNNITYEYTPATNTELIKIYFSTQLKPITLMISYRNIQEFTIIDRISVLYLDRENGVSNRNMHTPFDSHSPFQNTAKMAVAFENSVSTAKTLKVSPEQVATHLYSEFYRLIYETNVKKIKAYIKKNEREKDELISSIDKLRKAEFQKMRQAAVYVLISTSALAYLNLIELNEINQAYQHVSNFLKILASTIGAYGGILIAKVVNAEINLQKNKKIINEFTHKDHFKHAKQGLSSLLKTLELGDPNYRPSQTCKRTFN